MPFPNPYFIDPNAYQQMQQMAMQQYQNMQIPQQVTQSNVIIHVASEEVARKWDVAPNCSVMFINVMNANLIITYQGVRRIR